MFNLGLYFKTLDLTKNKVLLNVPRSKKFCELGLYDEYLVHVYDVLHDELHGDDQLRHQELRQQVPLPKPINYSI